MLSGNLNFDDFTKFRKQFHQLTEQFDRWLISFVTQQANQFIENVTRRTPVDTGYLASQWKIDRIVKRGNDLVVYYSNEAEYASWVEEGHAKPYKSGAAVGSIDWVNGFFMLKLSLDELYANMPREFDAAFYAFLEGLELV